MNFKIDGKVIETNEQGYLLDLDDWSEEFAARQARRDGVDLFVDHWELIWYFREYYAENQTNPTMHILVRSLGRIKGRHYHEQKDYEAHIYNLFPKNPLQQLCKLAGLPMPQPDT